MNNLDRQYQELLQDILLNGTVKMDRTNTGTISVFGRQIRHNMKEGFPLLTSKKMATKQIFTELLWFLRGETNIQSLVKDGNYIWVGDAYKKYISYAETLEEPEFGVDGVHIDDPQSNSTRVLTRTEFIEVIKTNDKFAAKWGELGPVYGHQWRKWTKPVTKVDEEGVLYEKGTFMGVHLEEIDQIAECLWKLKHKPDDRRNMVTAWNPADLEKATLPPCHYGFQLWTRELSVAERLDLAAETYDVFDPADFGIPATVNHEEIDKLYPVPRRGVSLMWNQRSCDVPLGIPFNIASYGALLQIFAQMSGMVAEELIGNLGDTHIYKNQTEGVVEQIARKSHQLPKLRINTEGKDDPSQLSYGDFELVDYVSEKKIAFPLSN